MYGGLETDPNRFEAGSRWAVPRTMYKERDWDRFLGLHMGYIVPRSYGRSALLPRPFELIEDSFPKVEPSNATTHSLQHGSF
jgi:hypothetical protein